MSKLGFLVAVSVVSLGAAVGAWYYKYQLYGWLPSTASSELKNVDGLLMDKEGKPFTGRVKDISDSGYSLYAYKACKSSKDHSKPRNEVDTSLKSPV